MRTGTGQERGSGDERGTSGELGRVSRLGMFFFFGIGGSSGRTGKSKDNGCNPLKQGKNLFVFVFSRLISVRFRRGEGMLDFCGFVACVKRNAPVQLSEGFTECCV